MNIWCPANNLDREACVINGVGSTDAITGLNIYAQNGFKSVSIYNGVTSQFNFGTMHCLSDYSASCTIDTFPSGGHMQCLDAPQTCDNPPGTVLSIF